MQPSKRIIINTIAQYVRSIFGMVLSLIATRIILKSLGVDDYGIYSIIAGVVSLLSFITNALAVSTQRYLSVSQGYADMDEGNRIFNTSVILHLGVGVIIVLCLELLFPILMNGFLNIPDNRLEAAKVLYHLVVGILLSTLISSPYRAAIIAHENIVYISVIEVADAVFKLLIAISLVYICYDKLIVYGILLLGIQVFNFVALSSFAQIKYKECRFPSLKSVDGKYMKSMFSFAGWTMYNIGCNYGRTQGVAVALNKALGTAVNAAYGLAFQVSGALSSLAQSLSNAINPQLMRAEGEGDRTRMMRFAEIQSKFSFLMMAVLSIPAIFEMNSILSLWLGEVPMYSVLFCRMVIIAALCDLLTLGLGSANQAIGQIRNYTLVISTIKLSTFMFAALFLYLKLNILYVAISYVFIEALSAIIRIPFLKITADLDAKQFIYNVFYKELIPVLVLISSSALIVYCFDFKYRFLVTFSFSFICFCISFIWFGLCEDEKSILNRVINKIKNKI